MEHTHVEIGAIHLEGAKPLALPSHLSELKKSLWKDELVQSWKEVLAELEVAVEEISKKGGNVGTIFFCCRYISSVSCLMHMVDYSSSIVRRDQGWTVG